MALIKCPECGLDVSDKAEVCIHCGYPLHETKENDDSIELLFENFALSGISSGMKIHDIYGEVQAKASQIKFNNNKIQANDLIANSIIKGLSKCPQHCGWADVKLFCQLIAFENLSEDGMNEFTDTLYSIISIKETYSDGSGGYSYITQFFYPECMVMSVGSEKKKKKLMTVLKHPYFGSQTGYQYIFSMFKQHGLGNSFEQIEAINRWNEGIKCPVSKSKNVKKISTTNRLTSVALFGIASSKIGKQYECKNCKHKW